MSDDSELLRLYVEERSEAAFTSLVQRHFKLVYFAALRRTNGNVHLAQDVAQQVFTSLAQSASTLRAHTVLPGWLYVATRHAASKAARTELRRRQREQQAQSMHSFIPSPSDKVDWNHLRPALDAAMDEMPEPDRNAVLLRFFGGHSFAEIGDLLRVGENAARMRVERALEKLRALLERRGITSTSAALAPLLADQAGAATPAGLAVTVASAAFSSGPSSSILASTLLTLKLMSASKLILAGLGIAAVVFTVYERRELRRTERELDVANQASFKREQRASAREMQARERQQQFDARRVTPETASNAADESNAHAGSSIPNQSDRPKVVISGTPVPMVDLQDVGLATVADALQTINYAQYTGNAALLARSLTLRGAEPGRERVQALFESLPADLRVRFSSLEYFAAYVAVLNWSPEGRATAQSIWIGKQTENSADEVAVHIRMMFTTSLTGNAAHGDLVFNREADGWHQAFPIWAYLPPWEKDLPQLIKRLRDKLAESP